MKKFVIILSNGFEEIECVNVIDILRRGGVKIDILGIDNSTITGAHDISIVCDDVFDYYNALDYDGLILVGGLKNAQILRGNSDVIKLIKNYNADNKFICAICASPALVLAETGVFENKKATCYPCEKFISKLNDNIYIDKSVVVCDNIITSQSPYTAFAFALTILKTLGVNVETLLNDLKGN